MPSLSLTVAVTISILSVTAQNNGAGKLHAIGFDTFNTFSCEYNSSNILAQANAIRNVWGKSITQSWRINRDIKPWWNSIASIIDQASFNYRLTDFYGRNDMDIMEVGNTGAGILWGILPTVRPSLTSQLGVCLSRP
jgi:hypothetical protein